MEAKTATRPKEKRRKRGGKTGKRATERGGALRSP